MPEKLQIQVRHNHNIAVHNDLLFLSRMHNYNAWLDTIVSKYCHGSVLEIGSGIGIHSEMLVKGYRGVCLSDADESYVTVLKDRYKDNESVQVVKFVLGDTVPDIWINAFDSIAMLNVLEHIPNDLRAIENCSKALRKGGQLIIIVPALPFLFSSLDEAYGHFRRYSKKDAVRIANVAGLKPERIFYLNCVGIVGWIWASLRKAESLNSRTALIYDRYIVPLARRIEQSLPAPFGLSLIMILKKPFNS